MKRKALLILGLALLGAGSAHAGHTDRYSSGRSGDAWAREYAQTALRQVRQNHNRGCGYYGQRWSDSYQAHYQWALRADWRKSQAEIDQREADLHICTSRRGYSERHYRDDRAHGRGHRGRDGLRPPARFNRDELARWYADTALAQVGQSNRYGCRLASSSGRWSRSWNSHYRWALRQSRHDISAELRRRDRTLDDCYAHAYRGY